MAEHKTKKKSANILQILEYLDGPQVVLLRRSDDYFIIGVAINAPGSKYPFFGAAISHDQWERYRRGFHDLRFLFMFPRWKEWYRFELKSNTVEAIELTKTVKDSFAEENYVPEQGFFSYDHSEPIQTATAKGLATQKYTTDGIWEFQDFTEFYNKVADLYGFYLSLKKYGDDAVSPAQKALIRTSFADAQLRGGSSYVNLYSGLVSAQGTEDRLSIGKLQYASPGRVNVRGRLDIFSDILVCFSTFEGNYNNIKNSYNKLRGFLAKNKLLKAEAEKFDNNGALSKFILNESNKFAEELRLEDVPLIYQMVEKNNLKFAKVLLAHFRRVESYFMFFAEGRVKDPEIVGPEIKTELYS